MHFLHSGIDQTVDCASAAIAYFQSQQHGADRRRRNTKPDDDEKRENTMAYASTIQTSDTANLGRITAAVKEIAFRVSRYRIYRTTLNELGALSNRELADLGLSRANLRSIAYEAAYGN
jgi:uncharacterized protein YjiS (DUF1127 family)